MQNFSRWSLWAFILVLSSVALSHAQPDRERLDAISIEDSSTQPYRAGQLKDSLQRTESITAERIERRQAKTVADALEHQVGIDSQANDALCGIRRVQVNGLRGEYTTFLIDGIPLHSTVSSYYGIDSISTNGLAEIEVVRGSGAALAAPEAIGGVLNLRTLRPTRTGLKLDASGGNQSYRALSLLGTAVSQDGERRALITGQFDEIGQWDATKVGVSQSPARRNHSLMGKLEQDLTERTQLELRLASVRGETFGGPVDQPLFRAVVANTATPPNAAFEGGDVRRRYLGDPGGVLETVETERYEGSARLAHQFSDRTNFQGTLAYANQAQDSYYEGNDYANRDHTGFSDLRVNRAFGSHVITLGQDYKLQRMRSRSYAFFDVLGVPTDSFDHSALGFYLQDTWTVTDRLELAAAVRANQVQVNWRGLTAAENEIDQWLAVPRMHARFSHTGRVTSRLSLGQGYRAPLTFFESEHGILDNGFDVLISKVERSNSALYTLAYDDGQLSGSLTGAYTEVTNAASVDLARTPRPALQTFDGKVVSRTVDASIGYAWTPGLATGLSYERFFYSDDYKGILPIAPVEERAKLTVDAERAGYRLSTQAVWIGARDLAPYGYANRFNLSQAGVQSEPKSTRAPAFFTVDAKLSKAFARGYTAYVGVKNLFDYTQTRRESPFFYDASGELDVVHIWGPLRGRQIYAGVTAEF